MRKVRNTPRSVTCENFSHFSRARKARSPLYEAENPQVTSQKSTARRDLAVGAKSKTFRRYFDIFLSRQRFPNLSQPVLRCMKPKTPKSLVKNQQLDEISLLVQKAKRFEGILTYS